MPWGKRHESRCSSAHDRCSSWKSAAFASIRSMPDQCSALIGGTKRIMPTAPDYKIQPGDTLMLVGEEKAVARFLAEH